jgi:hypothetical protein
VNLARFIRDHETGVRGRPATPDLVAHHRQQMRFLQKEREVHLLVTLAFALFTLLSAGFAIAAGSLAAWVLTGLFMLLLVPYVFHYFLLENAVQRWYLLLLEIQGRLQSGSGLPVGKGEGEDVGQE